MKRLYCLKDILLNGDYIRKLNLKDADFLSH